MVCVVAPQVVKFNRYWSRFELYTQFQMMMMMTMNGFITDYMRCARLRGRFRLCGSGLLLILCSLAEAKVFSRTCNFPELLLPVVLISVPCKSIFWGFDPNNSLLHCSKLVISVRIDPLSNLVTNMAFSCIFEFCLLPSLQSAFVRSNSVIFSPPPEKCHLETLPSYFRPCKLLTSKLHLRSWQPCQNTHTPIPFCLLCIAFFFLSGPRSWPEIFLTKASKSAYITKGTCLYGLGYPKQPSPRGTLGELTFH